jgi:hypothetical protein
MLLTFATLSAHTARRLFELGALLGLLSGVVLLLGGLPFLRRLGQVIAGILLAVGFALIIYAIHFGARFWSVNRPIFGPRAGGSAIAKGASLRCRIPAPQLPRRQCPRVL